MAFLEQNRNTFIVLLRIVLLRPHCVLGPHNGRLPLYGKIPPPELISEIYNPAFESAFSHGPCWKVNLSSARLLFRICLAIAKC